MWTEKKETDFVGDSYEWIEKYIEIVGTNQNYNKFLWV